MLKKAFLKKRKWIAGAVAGIVAVSIVSVGLYNSTEVALAKASLPKIESYNQENDKEHPFTILEIVPSYDEARIGYLVAGQEPAYYDGNGVKALADMGSEKERTNRFTSTNVASFGAFAEFTAITDASKQPFTWSDYVEGSDDANKSFDVYGVFKEVTGGDYKDNRAFGTSFVKVPNTINDPEDPSRLTIEDVLNKQDDRTTHALYCDNVVYSVSKTALSDGVNLEFTRYEQKTDDALIPFKIPKGAKDYYNWYYYLLDKAITVSYSEDETKSYYTVPDDILNSFSKEDVTPLYKRNGAQVSYIGFISYDETEQAYMFTDVSNVSDCVKVNGESGDSEDSLAERIYIQDLEIFTVRYYDSKTDSGLQNDRMYISGVTTNSSGTAVVTEETYDQALVMEAGDDLAAHFVRLEDDLIYHTFYYIPSDKEEFEFVADHSGERNFVSGFKGTSLIDSFKYKGGFDNNEWFKQYVLDLVLNKEDASLDECGKSIVDVVTKTANEVEAADIEGADFVYIQGGLYESGEDISTDAAKALIGSIKANKPIAVEGNLLYNGVYNVAGEAVRNGSDSQPLTNLYNVVVALEQGSLSDSSIDELLADWDATKHIASRVDDTLNKSYTNRTVFVYNGDSKTSDKKIVSEDFYKVLSGEGPTDDLGYREVIEDINSEMFYLKVAGSTAEFNDKISIATCIRHIINFGNRRVASKKTIRVLDIEPFYSPIMESHTEMFWNKAFMFNGRDNDASELAVTYDKDSRDIFSKKWFMENIGTQIEQEDSIVLTGMGTREFIGNIQDLNANYDLIYIGLDTQYFNTGATTSGEKGKEPLYNDGKKQVYRHIGDTMRAENEYSGGGMSTTGTFATSGDDITFEKLRELQAYVEAGYAVLLSDGFYKYEADGSIKEVNTDKIDEKSYMYDFALWLLYGNNPDNKDKSKGYIGKNVSVKKNFVDNDFNTTGKTINENQIEFSKYLNISKLVIDEASLVVPTPYLNEYATNEEDKYRYLTMNSDGIYTLNFNVKLTNDAAVDTSHTSYDCKLYIDHDADGRFEDVEALNGLVIVDENNNAATFEDGKFKLTTGKTYRITRRVPEGYIGFLSWKLVFYENDRVFEVSDSSSSTNLIRTAIQGYSAVPDYKSDPPVIKVLQIISGDGTGGTNLDLTDPTMQELYTKVKDFKIHVEQISAKEFISNPDGLTYDGTKLDYLMQYDMVVMGFADSYNASYDANNSPEAFYALRQYILSGKSMLFTHDLNSTYANDVTANWGGTANKYLRDLQGMDRYGVTKNNLSDLASFGTLKEYKSRYDNDEGYTDIFGKESHKSTDSEGNLLDSYGWNTATLLRYHFLNRNGSKPNGYGDVALKNSNIMQYDNPGYTSDRVTRVNQGQITEYPFHINKEIPVATTHPQYFQLNLDTDSKDTNYDDDIVVWYTISNQVVKSENDREKVSYYTMDYNDTRNNYYIYNKGNITYTGAGHSKVTGDEEKKLFVNTLVAAYNAGDHAPIAKYRQYPREMANDITAMYEPYDTKLRSKTTGAETGGFIEDSIVVHVKPINNNLQNNVYLDTQDNTVKYKAIVAQYYVEVDKDTPGAIKIGDSYYKVIEPTSCMMVVDSNSKELDTPIPASYSTLNNYAIYTMKFNISDFVTTSTSEGLNVLDKHSAKLYIRLSVETPLNNMNESVEVLPATDSMNPLSINFTELYELQ